MLVCYVFGLVSHMVLTYFCTDKNEAASGRVEQALALFLCRMERVTFLHGPVKHGRTRGVQILFFALQCRRLCEPTPIHHCL